VPNKPADRKYLRRPYEQSPLLQFLDGSFHPDWRPENSNVRAAIRGYLNSARTADIVAVKSDIAEVIDQFGDLELRDLIAEHMVNLSDSDRLGMDIPEYLLWVRQQLPGDTEADRARFAGDKQLVMSSSVPSGGENLLGMQIDFDAYLEEAAIFDGDISVRSTEDALCLLRVEGRAKPGLPPDVVAAKVEWAWLEHLRYRFFESHTVRLSGSTVILEFVTQIGASDFYVTGKIEVATSASTATTTVPQAR
jgi:hypothetical protein